MSDKGRRMPALRCPFCRDILMYEEERGTSRRLRVSAPGEDGVGTEVLCPHCRRRVGLSEGEA